MLALWIVALAAGCGRSGADATARRRMPPLVAVTAVLAREVPVEVRAPVDLRPLASADVGSKVLGYLDAVLVDRGDRVRRGQVVALVRPSDLPDLLAAQQSTLAQAQASLALARTNQERAQGLAPSGAVSQQELQQATSALAAAQAAEAATHAQIDALAARLGETRITSPLDGVVSQRRLDPGSLVGPGGAGAIITVARVDVLRAFVAVNERQARLVRIGQEARVELDAVRGRSFTGRVVRVAPAFDPTSRTLDAEVHLENASGDLLPGMYGRCSIVLDRHADAAVVPVSAVQINAREAWAFVVDGNRVRRRVVEVGVDGGDWLEIVRGLRPGEEVVSAGLEGLADGMSVRASRGVDPFTGDGAPRAPGGAPGVVPRVGGGR